MADQAIAKLALISQCQLVHVSFPCLYCVNNVCLCCTHTVVQLCVHHSSSTGTMDMVLSTYDDVIEVNNGSDWSE